MRNYQTLQMFVSSAQGHYEMEKAPAVTFVVSPPGCGKTALCTAVERLLQNQPPIIAGSQLPSFDCHPCAFLHVKRQLATAEVLSELLRSVGVESKFSRVEEGDIKFARLRLRQRGVCFILVDELQFLTRSANANALISRILTFIMLLGFPIFVFANYSLVHVLRRRPPQETGRFFSDPEILLPEAQVGKFFVLLVSDLAVILGRSWKIEKKHFEDLLSMCSGIRRSLFHLVAFGYLNAAVSKSSSITIDHLRKAYESAAFQEDRMIGRLTLESMLGVEASSFEYSCPFQLPPSVEVGWLKEVGKRRQKEINKEMMRASLSSSERNALDSGALAASGSSKARRRPSPKKPDDLRGELF